MNGDVSRLYLETGSPPVSEEPTRKPSLWGKSCSSPWNQEGSGVPRCSGDTPRIWLKSQNEGTNLIRIFDIFAQP